MATAQHRMREYQPSEVVAFRKTREAFGGLSNMAAGYPLNVAGIRIATSEALYQSCRFPHLPDVQKLIIDQASPMTAKMRSKPYRSQSRNDWGDVRIPVMKWCLRVKLVQNWNKFGELLLETGDRPIVEDSRKDEFWGAICDDGSVFRGENILGRLLMELREKLKTDPESLEVVYPLQIPDFLLLGRDIPVIARTTRPVHNVPSVSGLQQETAPQLPLQEVAAKPIGDSEGLKATDLSAEPTRAMDATRGAPPPKHRKLYLVAAAAAALVMLALIGWLITGS